MEVKVYKISIDLKRPNGPVVTVSTRGKSGRVLRSGGLVNDQEALLSVVSNAFHGADEFDEVVRGEVQSINPEQIVPQHGRQADKE